MASKPKKQTEDFILDEWRRYRFKLDEKELAYIRKFYREYERADLYGEEDNILEGDMRKEAIHKHNAKNLDAINKIGLHDKFKEESTKEFMEDASDDWRWMDTYKTLGYKYAVDDVINQAIENLDNKYLDKRVTLLKYHVKMNKLRILNNRQTVIDREKK